MVSPFALIAFFTLALFADITAARKDPGGYWQADVAKNEALVEAIKHLVHVDAALSNQNKIKSDCHTSKKDSAANKKSFATDFEPIPNVSAYGDDAKLKDDKSFMKDFDPRPNVSVYDNDTGLKGEKKFEKDFEPRPNVSAYGDDAKLKDDKSFIKDFEPRPNISVYDKGGAGLKGEKKFEKDFEPRPNVSVYQG